ncbi:MAG: LuxR C-terminal-related transcriptional regulator [Chloroflexota bacterium]
MVVDSRLPFREQLIDACAAKAARTAAAANCQEAGEAAASLQPDLVFFDEDLLDDCGLPAAVEALRAANPQVRVIFLSEAPSEANLLRAYRQGGCGYLVKGQDVLNLLPAVFELQPGEFLLSPRLAHMAVGSLGDLRGALEVSEINRLTGREKEVLHQLCAGFSNREIAQNLVISENTVRIHVQNVLKKLNLQRRRQVQEKYRLFDRLAYAMVYAVPEDLVPPGFSEDA